MTDQCDDHPNIARNISAESSLNPKLQLLLNIQSVCTTFAQQTAQSSDLTAFTVIVIVSVLLIHEPFLPHSDMEKSVEELQQNSSVSHGLVTEQDVEQKSKELRMLGETLTELKSNNY